MKAIVQGADVVKIVDDNGSGLWQALYDLYVFGTKHTASAEKLAALYNRIFEAVGVGDPVAVVPADEWQAFIGKLYGGGAE